MGCAIARRHETPRSRVLALTQLFYPAVFLAVVTLFQTRVSAQAVLTAVDCAHLTTHASVADHTICETPDLAQLSSDIDSFSNSLEMMLKESLVD